MTCIAKGMYLSIRVGTTKQRSIAHPYRWVIVGFDDENFSRPSLQVIRRELWLAGQLMQSHVLMYENFFQQIGSDCFVKVGAPELSFRMISGTKPREQ